MNTNRHTSLSDEQFNAYIDDELDIEERQRVFAQLADDQELNQEAQELLQLRAMLRNAYRTPPPAPPRAPHRNRSRLALRAIAATLLLAVGAVSGWYGNTHYANPAGQELRSATATLQKERLLLHINSNDPYKMEKALDYAEQVLASHRDRHSRFALEIVANDLGIDLLRRETSPFAQRIAALRNEYDNVRFLACAVTLRRLQEQGIQPQMLPGTEIDQNAVDEIVKRIKEGWHYVKA